jgi:hypothetical protein
MRKDLLKHRNFHDPCTLITYLAHDHYLAQSRFQFVKYDDSDSKSNNMIYLGVRSYDYLVSSEVKNKLSSKLVAVMLAS